MHATGQDLVRVLRAAGRAAIDYALPPRCPACGTIVGADRQFCLACWSSLDFLDGPACARCSIRSEEHTSELQSLMRISYAVFCLKKKTININASTLDVQHHASNSHT